MPLFEFSCRQCGAQFEDLVHEGSVVRCAKCDSTDVEKLFSAFAVGRSGGRSLPRASSAAACGAPAPT